MPNTLIIFNHSQHDIIYNKNYHSYNIIKTLRNIKNVIEIDENVVLPFKKNGTLLLRMEHTIIILDYKKMSKFVHTSTVNLHIYDTVDSVNLLLNDQKYEYKYNDNDQIYIQSDDIGDTIVENITGHFIVPINKLGYYGSPRKNIIPRSIRHIILYTLFSIGIGATGYFIGGNL